MSSKIAARTSERWCENPAQHLEAWRLLRDGAARYRISAVLLSSRARAPPPSIFAFALKLDRAQVQHTQDLPQSVATISVPSPGEILLTVFFRRSLCLPPAAVGLRPFWFLRVLHDRAGSFLFQPCPNSSFTPEAPAELPRSPIPLSPGPGRRRSR